MPNLIEKGLRDIPLTAGLEQIREALNRDWQSLLKKARELINERLGFIRDLATSTELTSYDLDVGDEMLRIDTTEGDFTVNLVWLPHGGHTVYIAKVSNDSNEVKLVPNADDEIVGDDVIGTRRIQALRYVSTHNVWLPFCCEDETPPI